MRTADVYCLCDSGSLCFGDLLEVGLFGVQLYEIIMFIRLFNGADLKAHYLPSNEK
jgi:hypothetical protein